MNRPSGALASYTSGNGIVNTVEYTSVEQPAHVVSSGGVMNLTYAYDAAGNVTGIADGRQNQSATYDYDTLNRLVAAGGPWGNLIYAYDAVGNRATSTLNSTTTTYTYSTTTGRLVSAIGGGQSEFFLHDDAGRVTQDARVEAYSYTPANLVETASTWAGALTTSRYDADGQRVLKIAGNETSRTYVVNELSEFSTAGGPLTWTVDYVSAGSRLLAAVRPAAGTRYALTVTKAGTGTGRASAGDGGLDCGPDCAARYLDGTTVALTAVPAAYSYFVGWSGACSGTASTVTVTMDGAKTCTATFTQVAYTLTVQKIGEGADDSVVTSVPSGIACGASCSAAMGGGTTVQLAADAADGFEFVGWQGEGCTAGTVTMTGARTCTAVFQAAPPTCDPDGSLRQECRAGPGWWDAESCSCQYNWEDPLVLTLDGSPVHLTGLGAGVSFDVDGDGVRERIAWTRTGSAAAFLVLDLDGDGAMTTGAELFGVPVGIRRLHKPAAGENSFTLLAAYDAPAQGGNGDGAISAADAVFSRLRLWIDANHDGLSQPGELMSLSAAGIVSIELTYRTTGRRDGRGNFFRYRGVVHLTSGRRVPIWDVFLATAPGAGSPPEAAEGAAQFDDEPASAVTGVMEAEEARVAADGDARAASVSAAPDPTPTPLQVLEYYHLDALGSVRAVTDAQGQVIARHDFLPFGEELAAQNPPRDRKLFTGQERDFETGLDYFHARQLRVDLGRFTAPDPLTDLAWTDPTRGATTPYGYVVNNPLGYVDPDGLKWIVCSLGRAGEECPGVSNLEWWRALVLGGGNFKVDKDGVLWAKVNGEWEEAGTATWVPDDDSESAMVKVPPEFKKADPRITDGPAGGTTETQSDCIKAANKKVIGAMQGPGAWDTFRAAQPSMQRTVESWAGVSVFTNSWKLSRLGWAYVVNLLLNGKDQFVDSMKQFVAANSQYDADIAACRQLR